MTGSPAHGSAAAPADTPAPAMELPELKEAELDRLEALARAATKGPWKLFSGDRLFGIFRGPASTGKNEIVHWMGFDQLSTSWPQRGRDAAHIAAFDPPTVLRLLSQARRAASGSLLGGERERVARLIDPGLWADRDQCEREGTITEFGGYGAQKQIDNTLERAGAIIAALSAPPPPAAEPVAWAIINGDGRLDFIWDTAAKPEENGFEAAVPLYTAPQPGEASAAAEPTLHPALVVDVQEHRDRAYQGGWDDGYAEGYGKAKSETASQSLEAK